MDPAASAASGTEDQPCNGDTNPCIGQVTGQYEHGDVNEEYRREPRPRQTSPSRRCAFIGPHCDRGIGLLMYRSVPHIEAR